MTTKYFYLLFTIIFFLDASAQTKNLPSEWSLQDCITYAKQNNITLQSIRLNKTSANQDLLQAKAGKYPNFNASVSQGLFAVSGENSLHVQGLNSQNLGANSSMILYHDNYINNNISSKNLLVKMADLSVVQAENAITLIITQAFLDILMSQENIHLLENMLNTTKMQLQLGTQYFKDGSISKLDFLQLQSQEAQDEYNLIAAKNNLKLDLMDLKQILQLPSQIHFQILPSPNVEVSDDIQSLQEVQAFAQSQRPEIKYGQINIENAETSLRMTESSVKPSLSLGANIATGYQYGNGNYANQLGNNFYAPVGLSVGIPIYNNRIYRTNIAKSKINIEQAHLNLQQTKTFLNHQIEQAYINLQNSLLQYESAEKQMKINKESFAIFNEEMKVRAIDFSQLQEQKGLYMEAIENYLEAKYSAILNKEIYEFYAGEEIDLHD